MFFDQAKKNIFEQIFFLQLALRFKKKKQDANTQYNLYSGNAGVSWIKASPIRGFIAQIFIPLRIIWCF